MLAWVWGSREKIPHASASAQRFQRLSLCCFVPFAGDGDGALTVALTGNSAGKSLSCSHTAAGAACEVCHPEVRQQQEKGTPCTEEENFRTQEAFCKADVLLFLTKLVIKLNCRNRQH